MIAIGILLLCIGAAFWRFLGGSPVDRFFGNFNAYDRAAALLVGFGTVITLAGILSFLWEPAP